MQITYQGRHTEGVFVPSGAGELFVAHGESVDIDDQVAARLLAEQPDAFVKTTTGRKVVKAEEAE